MVPITQPFTTAKTQDRFASLAAIRVITILAICLVIAIPLRAQSSPWTTGADGAIYYTGGNVGIGTNAPVSKLDVMGEIRTLGQGAGLVFGPRHGSGASFEWYNDVGTNANLWSTTNGNIFTVSSSGNVGIGVTNPIGRLQVSDAADVRVALVPLSGANNRESLLDFWATFDNYSRDITVRRAGRIQVGFDGGVWGTEYMAFGVAGAGDTSSPPVERMRISGNGNVGIGTANPQSKLAVNGSITTKEVVVTNIGWSDYVFKPDYRLQTLREVSAYINEHHHLPDIPSESEVRQKGISIGDMQMKLLAKVEEVTLHLIQAGEINRRLEEQNRKLEERVARLELHASIAEPGK